MQLLHEIAEAIKEDAIICSVEPNNIGTYTLSFSLVGNDYLGRRVIGNIRVAVAPDWPDDIVLFEVTAALDKLRKGRKE